MATVLGLNWPHGIIGGTAMIRFDTMDNYNSETLDDLEPNRSLVLLRTQDNPESNLWLCAFNSDIDYTNTPLWLFLVHIYQKISRRRGKFHRI